MNSNVVKKIEFNSNLQTDPNKEKENVRINEELVKNENMFICNLFRNEYMKYDVKQYLIYRNYQNVISWL